MYNPANQKLEDAKDLLESYGYLVLEPAKADELRRKNHALGVMIQKLKQEFCHE